MKRSARDILLQAVAQAEQLEKSCARAERAVLGLLPPKRSRKFWLPAHDRVMRRDYANRSNADLARELGFTVPAVNNHAKVLGLRKSKAYMASLALASKLPEAGKPFRYQKGCAGGFRSEEQRKAFLEAGKRTRFQPGTKITNTWVPVGTERVDKDGNLVRKVSDVGGYNNRDWKPVAHIAWEKRRGPVPCGYLVRFKSGNKRDFRLSNLDCISKAENMARNTIHRYPLALKKTIMTLGALNRKINAKARSEDERNQGPA